MSSNWGQNIAAAEAYSHRQRKKRHDGALGEMEHRAKGADGKIMRMLSDSEVDEILERPVPTK